MGEAHFESHEKWQECVEKGTKGIIPNGVWNKTFYVKNQNGEKTKLTFLIKSAKINTQTKIEICG